MKTNEGLIDRVIRVIIGSVAIVAGGFWLGGVSQIVLLVVGVVTMLTGLLGFCGIYTLLRINTCTKSQKPLNIVQTAYLVGLSAVLIVAGSFASNKITQNKFLEDFNRMNGSYKQALFLTGQSKRDEAKSNYDQWVIGFQDFSKKYSQYKPFVLRNDTQFNSDLDKVATIIKDSKSGVYEGDLPLTHKKLEEVRPIFQEMFKRNGFSMLAITLTDFHDSMEKLITAADAKSPAGIISNYQETNSILVQVEEQLNDTSIKAIRKNLDDLLKLAQDNKVEELSKKAAEMKSSFVKVYLIKG